MFSSINLTLVSKRVVLAVGYRAHYKINQFALSIINWITTRILTRKR